MTGGRITRGARCALACLCLLAALAGCAGNKSCTKPSVYSSSSAGPPLRVPPDLSQPPENDTFEVPPGPTTSNAPPCGHYPPKVAERTTQTASTPTARPSTAPAAAPPPSTTGTETPPARPDVPIASPQPPASEPPPAAQSAGTAAAAATVSGALEGEVRDLVTAWARSWSDGDFQQYLSYYAQDFDPPGDLTLEEWQTARRSRLDKRPTMTVAPETLTVVEADSGRVVVEFVQRTELEGVAQTLRKGLVLVRESDAWRIQRETVLDVLSDPR